MEHGREAGGNIMAVTECDGMAVAHAGGFG